MNATAAGAIVTGPCWEDKTPAADLQRVHVVWIGPSQVHTAQL